MFQPAIQSFFGVLDQNDRTFRQWAYRTEPQAAFVFPETVGTCQGYEGSGLGCCLVAPSRQSVLRKEMVTNLPLDMKIANLQGPNVTGNLKETPTNAPTPITTNSSSFLDKEQNSRMFEDDMKFKEYLKEKMPRVHPPARLLEKLKNLPQTIPHCP